MTTSHLYGCEHKGCSDIGLQAWVWRPGFGWYSAYFCPAHTPPAAEGDTP